MKLNKILIMCIVLHINLYSMQEEQEKIDAHMQQVAPAQQAAAYEPQEAAPRFKYHVKSILNAANSPVNTVAISDDNSTLITGSDANIVIYEYNKQPKLYKVQSPIIGLSLSKNKDFMLTLSDKSSIIEYWDLKEINNHGFAINKTNIPNALDLSKDNSFFVVGYQVDPKTDSTKLVKVNINPETHKLSTHKKVDIIQADTITSVAISSDNKLIVAGNINGSIDIINAYNMSTIKVLKNPSKKITSVVSVAITNDNNYLVVGYADGTIKIINIGDENKIRIIQGHRNQVSSLKLSADNSLIVTGSDDHTVKVWDYRTGRLLQTLLGHTDEVRSVAISNDNKYIVSGAGDKTILWERVQQPAAAAAAAAAPKRAADIDITKLEEEKEAPAKRQKLDPK